MKVDIERLRELLVDACDEEAREIALPLYEEILEALNGEPVEREIRTSAECRAVFVDTLNGEPDV